MDYYYALLENYDQLKRRKFKLSLREEEAQEGEDNKADDAARQAADAAFKAAQEVKPEDREALAKSDELTFVKKAGDASKTSALGGPFKSAPMKSVGSLDDLDDKTLAKVVGYFKDKEGGEGGEGGDDPNAQQVDPAQQAARAAVQRAQEVQAEFMGDDISQRLPKYDDTERSRLDKQLGITRKAVEDETEGTEGVSSQSAVSQDQDLMNRYIASPELSPEQVTGALDTYTKSMELVMRLQAGEELTVAELREVSEKLEVTDQGVRFNGIYLQIRTKSNAKNDPYRALVEELNNGIKKNNDKLKGLDKDSDAYKEGFVKPLVTENQGRVLANRGPLLEKVAVLRGLANALQTCESRGDCAEVEKKLADYYEQATQDLTVEEVKEMLKKGLCAQAGQCLVDIDGANDAIITESIFRFLTGTDADGNLIQGMDSPRMKPEVARALIERGSKNGGVGLALLVASSRGFGEAYADLEIVDADQFGGIGADLKGQKADICYKVTAKSLEKYKARLEKNQTEVEKKQSEAAKCAGEGVGIDSLGSSINEASDGGEVVEFCVEQKALNSTKGSRLKAGEGNHSKHTKSAQTGERGKNDLEKEFYDVNDRRLRNCQGDMKFGEHKTSKEAADAFSKRVYDSPTMTAFRAVSQPPGYITDSDGNKIRGAGDALVDQWMLSSGMDEAKKLERAELAKQGFAAIERGQKPTKEQQKAIDKIGEGLEQAQISEQLDADTGPDGVVTGESLGYILQRQSEDGGSLNECVKDVQSMEDGDQRMGLINESIYGSYGMVCNGDAVVKRKKGSSSYSVETNDGEKMMGGQFERGQLIVSIEAETMGQQRGDRSSKQESEREDASLFVTFLKGQQELLEKLMRQTSAGPNF